MIKLAPEETRHIPGKYLPCVYALELNDGSWYIGETIQDKRWVSIRNRVARAREGVKVSVEGYRQMAEHGIKDYYIVHSNVHPVLLTRWESRTIEDFISQGKRVHNELACREKKSPHRPQAKNPRAWYRIEDAETGEISEVNLYGLLMLTNHGIKSMSTHEYRYGYRLISVTKRKQGKTWTKEIWPPAGPVSPPRSSSPTS